MTPANDLAHEVEEERLRQVSKLAADSGTEWADGFRPGTSGCHELLDRTQLMADMLEQHLLNHPACIADAEWYALAERAASALRELYQRVGAEHLAADGNGTPETHAGRRASESRPASRAASTQTEVPCVENKDVELVAIWLHGAARTAGHSELFRTVMKQAAREAGEMYALPTDQAATDEDEGDFGTRDALARFISKWDECERTAREDEASS